MGFLDSMNNWLMHRALRISANNAAALAKAGHVSVQTVQHLNDLAIGAAVGQIDNTVIGLVAKGLDTPK